VQKKRVRIFLPVNYGADGGFKVRELKKIRLGRGAGGGEGAETLKLERGRGLGVFQGVLNFMPRGKHGLVF